MVCAPIAKILLEAHADPNLSTKKGNTVLDALFRPRNVVSQSWDGVQTLKLLIRHGLSREILSKWSIKIKHVRYLSPQQIKIFEGTIFFHAEEIFTDELNIFTQK